MVSEKKKAVFLDRDGVLCEDTDYVTSFEKMHIFPFAREAVKRIQEKGYLAIVVTNQSAIARGMMSEQQLAELHRFLISETGVDAVYYCPHLPPEAEEMPPYRVFCRCRKPDTGMLERAALEHDIALEDSYMVGDRASDMETGRRAGTKTVYISPDRSNVSGVDVVCDTLLSFSELLNG